MKTVLPIYVCMCIYLCIRVQMYICACIYVYLHTCMNMFVCSAYVCTCAYVYVCIVDKHVQVILLLS